MSSRPLALSDAQLDQILRSAQPLRPSARSAFLEDVAQALNGHELGDGFVQRTCATIQRKYFDAPLETAHTNVGKYGR
jgi:hypothetical protein